MSLKFVFDIYGKTYSYTFYYIHIYLIMLEVTYYIFYDIIYLLFISWPLDKGSIDPEIDLIL